MRSIDVQYSGPATASKEAILAHMRTAVGQPYSDTVVEEDIRNLYKTGIVQNVREGEPLWRSLENTAAMSDLAVEMIKVGESTGALTEMLGNVSEFYDEEIESRLTRLVSAIEPMILVFMGVVIAILLYAFYLPLFQLSNVQQ